MRSPRHSPHLPLATPADMAALGRLHVRAWRESYPGIVPDAVLAAMDPAERAVMWHGVLARGGRIRLARLDDELVGFGASGVQREPEVMPCPGEFYSIYLLKRAQGSGLGRALMAAMAADLLEQGLRSANLWMLDGNAAAGRFYTALGGRRAGGRSFVEGAWHGHDTAFVWDDLSRLLPTPPGHAASAEDTLPDRP